MVQIFKIWKKKKDERQQELRKGVKRNRKIERKRNGEKRTNLMMGQPT